MPLTTIQKYVIMDNLPLKQCLNIVHITQNLWVYNFSEMNSENIQAIYHIFNIFFWFWISRISRWKTEKLKIYLNLSKFLFYLGFNLIILKFEYLLAHKSCFKVFSDWIWGVRILCWSALLKDNYLWRLWFTVIPVFSDIHEGIRL